MEKLLLAFVDTLDSLHKKIQEELGAAYGISHLTIPLFQYINAIYDLGSPTLTELAERLNITRASVSVGIAKLLRTGYVIKTQSSEDRRVVHVCLSEAGNNLVKAKFKALQEYSAFILGALTEREARQFKEILSRIVILFEEAGQSTSEGMERNTR